MTAPGDLLRSIAYYTEHEDEIRSVLDDLISKVEPDPDDLPAIVFSTLVYALRQDHTKALAVAAVAVMRLAEMQHAGKAAERDREHAGPGTACAVCGGPCRIDRPAPQPVTACSACRMPFDPADPAFDGRARHGATSWCRRCVDRCHDATDFAHACPVCRTTVVPAIEGGLIGGAS